MEPATQYVVMTAASVTAGAASFVAWRVRGFTETVERNEERSERNETILTGEGAPHVEGVLNRLEQLEAEHSQ